MNSKGSWFSCCLKRFTPMEGQVASELPSFNSLCLKRIFFKCTCTWALIQKACWAAALLDRCCSCFLLCSFYLTRVWCCMYFQIHFTDCFLPSRGSIFLQWPDTEHIILTAAQPILKQQVIHPRETTEGIECFTKTVGKGHFQPLNQPHCSNQFQNQRRAGKEGESLLPAPELIAPGEYSNAYGVGLQVISLGYAPLWPL